MAVGRDLAVWAANKLVYTLETPRDVKRQHKQLRRVRKEPWSIKYFGMLPLALHIWWNKKE